MPLEVSLIQNYTLKLVSGVPVFIQPRLEVGSIGKLEWLATCLGSTFKARAWFRLKKFGLVPPPGRIIFSENPRSLKNVLLGCWIIERALMENKSRHCVGFSRFTQKLNTLVQIRSLKSGNFGSWQWLEAAGTGSNPRAIIMPKTRGWLSNRLLCRIWNSSKFFIINCKEMPEGGGGGRSCRAVLGNGFEIK